MHRFLPRLRTSCRTIVCLLLSWPALPASAPAQLLARQHTACRDEGSGPFLRFYYQNDAFTGTDYYHSQHASLSLTAPFLRANPLNRILLRTDGDSRRYGISLSHDVWTPTSILSDSILHGDRPYAATLLVESHVVTVSGEGRKRFTASLSLGIIGPAAGGFAMQKGIHERTGNAIPRGWQHQIANAPVVNYGLCWEKQLLAITDHALLGFAAGLDAGTLRTAGSTGLTGMLGIFNSPFLPGRRRHQVFAYGSAMAVAVAHDATLQGGLPSGRSPHAIPAADISRGLLQARAGLALRTAWVSVEGCLDWKTREFAGGRPHREGSVLVAFHW